MSDDESAHIQPAVLGLTNDQRCLKEFILQLESMPELWDPSSKSYMNKIKRTARHEKLLLILKKINDNATVGDVRKKINSLRSNYRKEFKKIIDSKRSGAGTEDVYIPKSWIFNALHFLNKNEKPVDLNQVESQNVDELVQVEEQTNREDLSNTSFSSISELAPPRKNKKNCAVGKQNELIEKACSLLSAPQSSTNINATALYWSEKLEHLNPTQRMLAVN
ncbi:PREDICTED: uncharacterized protein LOC108365689 [Rhagoletis zephyria]|uniref:uncharacterized protein LOC108365689 n=1 Tax=Rhagoletis zephyria TaxID=28612 RepID=UPI000811333F|nr:PREDICTED: uncharacterized protein LOC108365689 [Rhagoletis zephyria]